MSRLSSNTLVNIIYAANSISASQDSSGHRAIPVFSYTVAFEEQDATSPEIPN